MRYNDLKGAVRVRFGRAIALWGLYPPHPGRSCMLLIQNRIDEIPVIAN